MCSCHFPEDIIVCPACKRDDEGYKTGLSDSPFRSLGAGLVKCRCGYIFKPEDSFAEAHPAGRAT